jgi:hypothetical protein
MGPLRQHHVFFLLCTLEVTRLFLITTESFNNFGLHLTNLNLVEVNFRVFWIGQM